MKLSSPCIVSLCVNDKCCGFTCLRRDIAPAFTLASPGERHLESAWTVLSVLSGSQVSKLPPPVSPNPFLPVTVFSPQLLTRSRTEELGRVGAQRGWKSSVSTVSRPAASSEEATPGLKKPKWSCCRCCCCCGGGFLKEAVRYWMSRWADLVGYDLQMTFFFLQDKEKEKTGSRTAHLLRRQLKYGERERERERHSTGDGYWLLIWLLSLSFLSPLSLNFNALIISSGVKRLLVLF